MNKKIVIIGMVFLLLSPMIIMIKPSCGEPVVTIYVDDDNTQGPWDGTLDHPYQYIQDAIDASSNEDTVFVYEGTYVEHIDIDKSINLLGENKVTTVIDADQWSSAIRIMASEVTVKGFTLTNALESKTEIYLDPTATGTTISGNIITGVGLTGGIYGSCDYVTITDNDISVTDGWCINILGDYNLIKRNTLHDSNIGLIHDPDSVGTIIYENNFVNNIEYNAVDWGNHEFYDAEIKSGNYWDDYTGSDSDGDGIGDTSYTIPEGRSLDLYPYMVENGWIKPLEIQSVDEIQEKTDFQVIITAYNQPIGNAIVTFSNVEYLTNTDGTVTITAPEIEQDINILLSVNKEDCKSAEKWITILDENLPEEKKQLVVDTVSEVNEKELFDVTVSAEGNVIEDVVVIFDEITYYTNSYGMATITASSVDIDTEYVIYVSKEGFESATAKVIIADTSIEDPKSKKDGWIYGTVYNGLGIPLENVEVSVILSNEKNIIIRKSVFTEEDGRYNVSLDSGIYDMEASKEGYLKSIVTDVNVVSNTGTLQNFILTEQTFSMGSDEDTTESFVKYCISTYTINGDIGGICEVDSDEIKYSYYMEDVEILKLESDESMASFKVSADEKSDETVLLFHIGLDYSLDYLDGVEIFYDYKPIEEIADVISFFDQDFEEPVWLGVQTVNGLYVFIKVPTWSEHIITISSIVEAINVLSATILYISVFLLLCVVYIIPFFLYRET